MPLLTNVPGVGYIHGSAIDVDRELREGDGLAWSGDPRLELRIGILSAPKRMQHPKTGKWINRGDQIAKRYEVWRYNEDGSESMVGHWLIGEIDRIIFDIARMRAGAEGRIEGVLDRIDKANAEIEKKNSAQFRDSYGEALEHLSKLDHDRNNPRNVFRGIPGRRDEGSTDAGQ